MTEGAWIPINHSTILDYDLPSLTGYNRVALLHFTEDAWQKGQRVRVWLEEPRQTAKVELVVVNPPDARQCYSRYKDDTTPGRAAVECQIVRPHTVRHFYSIPGDPKKFWEWDTSKEIKS